jgi:hypothetical protein
MMSDAVRHETRLRQPFSPHSAPTGTEEGRAQIKTHPRHDILNLLVEVRLSGSDVRSSRDRRDASGRDQSPKSQAPIGNPRLGV